MLHVWQLLTVDYLSLTWVVVCGVPAYQKYRDGKKAWAIYYLFCCAASLINTIILTVAAIHLV